MNSNIYHLILRKIRIALIIFCALILSLSPLQSLAISSQAFYSQRKICTDNYYNLGLYTQATDCYRQAWVDSCPYDQDACNKAKNNMYIAMDNHRTYVCNNYYNNGSYSLAGNCYDIGIAETCNSNPKFDDLCDKNRNNRNTVNNYLLGLGQYSNNYTIKIQQLKDFKTNCNRNWYNGYIRAFIDCSNQGANDACSISGFEATELCNNFRNNADIGNNRLSSCGYYNSYNNYNCGEVSSGVKDAALIATGAVLLCVAAGCFNNNNSSTTNYGSGGGYDSGYYNDNYYYDNGYYYDTY